MLGSDDIAPAHGQSSPFATFLRSRPEPTRKLVKLPT